MSEFLPMPAAEMKAVVERGERLAFSLPVGSIVAGHEEVWIKAECDGGNQVRWFAAGEHEPVAGRDVDAEIASGAAKVIRVGHEAVTP